MPGFKLYIALGLIAAAVAGLVATHAMVYRAGIESERAAALSRSVYILRERAKGNEEIRNLDDSALCARLGGVWREGKCQ